MNASAVSNGFLISAVLMKLLDRLNVYRPPLSVNVLTVFHNLLDSVVLSGVLLFCLKPRQLQSDDKNRLNQSLGRFVITDRQCFTESKGGKRARFQRLIQSSVFNLTLEAQSGDFLNAAPCP